MSDLSLPLGIVIIHAHGRTTLEVRGELDVATAPELAVRLEAVIDNATGGVAVDMAEVSFLDSSGLMVLVMAHRRLGLENRPLSVRNPSPAVVRVLKLSGIDRVLADDEEPALSPRG